MKIALMPPCMYAHCAYCTCTGTDYTYYTCIETYVIYIRSMTELISRTQMLWSLIVLLQWFREIYRLVAIELRLVTPGGIFSPRPLPHYWISPICRATSSCSFCHVYRVTVSPTFLSFSNLASLRPGQRGALARNINLRGSGNSLLDLARRSLRPK